VLVQKLPPLKSYGLRAVIVRAQYRNTHVVVLKHTTHIQKQGRSLVKARSFARTEERTKRGRSFLKVRSFVSLVEKDGREDEDE
jgi:hypothetical protein